MMGRGFAHFRKFLNPKLVSEFEELKSHSEFAKLYAKLDSIRLPDKFLDHWSEFILARYLYKLCCSFKVEVPNNSGKQSDFECVFNECGFCIHVKRVNPDISENRQIGINSRLNRLEKIQIPFCVEVRLLEDIDDCSSKHLLSECKRILKFSNVGDLFEVESPEGNTIAEVSVLERTKQNHVTLVWGPSFRFYSDEVRLKSQLIRAYRSFDVEKHNLIAIASSGVLDRYDFKDAIFGSESAGKGFWAKGEHVDSKSIIWFQFNPQGMELDMALFTREGIEKKFAGTLKFLFEREL